MFDEYDEGTAILPAVALKRNLPSGGEFIALDADGDLSLPSDWYLKIAAFAAEVMRGQREVEKTLPRKILLGDYWGSRKHGPATSSSGGSGSYVPNQTKVQEQKSSPSASAPTSTAAPVTTGFWEDVKDTKDDEPPPPAYSLEAGEHAPTPSATNAPSAATPTSQPPPPAAPTAGDSSHNRASAVHTSSPTASTQQTTHRFAPPPSAPPIHTFSPPSTGPAPTPPHSPSAYHSSVASLASDFSRMNTGPTPPSLPGNQTEFPFNRPTEAVPPQQYTHYTAPQSTHQNEHAHSGSHGSPSPPTGGWTAAPAGAGAGGPPPGTHSLSSQYPHHSSPAPQTQQWGRPSSPPPTSSGLTAYPGVQSPWHLPQPATSNHAGVQQGPGQKPPTDQTGTLYGSQPQAGNFPSHAGTSYPPPPGPPQPPQPPNMGGASGSGSSGPQTQPDPNNPNKRTSYTISRSPVLIRFGTLC